MQNNNNKPTLKFVLMLSVLAALVGVLSLVSTQSPTGAPSLVPAVDAAPAPVVNNVDISFRNARGQEIGEGRPFPLDRVSRGEQFTSIVRAQQYPIKIRVRAANGFQREVTVHSEARFQDRVPTDPSFDNITVTVFAPSTNHQLAQRRLPIGSK